MKDHKNDTIEHLLNLLYQKAAQEREVKRRNIIDPYIEASDGNFLGVINTNRYDPNSIFNVYGLYGSRYSATSIFNKYGTYGSQYSVYSPFNKYTATPPKIIYQNTQVGFLTKNKYLMNSIDPDKLFSRLRSEPLPNWYQVFSELRNT